MKRLYPTLSEINWRAVFDGIRSTTADFRIVRVTTDASGNRATVDLQGGYIFENHQGQKTNESVTRAELERGPTGWRITLILD